MDEPAPPLGFAVMTLIDTSSSSDLIPFHTPSASTTAYGEHLNPNVDERTETSPKRTMSETATPRSRGPDSLFLHWMHQWHLAALFMIQVWARPLPSAPNVGHVFDRARETPLVPMVFGMWTIGFLNSVLTARGSVVRANGVVEVWLEHMVWTCAVLGAHPREVCARSSVVSLEFSAVLLPADSVFSRSAKKPAGTIGFRSPTRVSVVERLGCFVGVPLCPDRCGVDAQTLDAGFPRIGV